MKRIIGNVINPFAVSSELGGIIQPVPLMILPFGQLVQYPFVLSQEIHPFPSEQF
jgi:hypothetical protein